MSTGVTVDFNVNLARFTSAIDKATNDLNRFQSNAGRVSDNIGKAFGALGVGLSVGGVVAYGKAIIDAADTMNDLSQRIGINVKDLATWQLAASQSGTTMESVAKGVKGLSVFMVENGDALKKTGINATTANGALIELADLFKAMPDGVEKTALAVKVFGKAGMEMIPMLNQGSEGLRDAQEKAKAYGERLAALAPKADVFNDQLAELALQSKAAGMNITTWLLPGLTGMATWLNDLKAGGDRAATALEFLSEKSPLFRGMVEFNKLANSAGALMGLGGDQARRSSGGNIAGGAGDMAAFDAAGAAYMAERAARQRALGLLGKQGGGAVAGGSDAALRRMLERGQNNLNSTVDSEEEMRILADKRAMEDTRKEFDALQRMLKVGEENELAAYYSTAGEETMRLVAEQRNLKDAIKENDNFARDMGLSFSSAFEEAVIGGKKLSEVFQGLAQDVARIVLRKTVTEPLGNAVSGFVQSSGVGDFFKSLIPKYAQGTPWVPNDGLAYLHQGEQVIPAGRSGGVNIVVNNTAAPDVTATATARNNNGAMEIEVIVQRAIARDMSRNGPITQGFGSMFGLARAV